MISSYLVENKNIGVKRCRHGIFAYNRNDAFIGMSLDLYGEWCEFEIQLLREFITPGSIVIDAGANIGTHTVAFANLVGPNGKVYAFEPQPRSFHLLCANLALNCIENVVAREEALSHQSGKISMAPLPNSETFFNFGGVALSQTTGTPVSATTIDGLDLTSCELIKIDVEGMEVDVIRGAINTITKFKPFLYLENNENESDDIAKALDDIGYKAFWSLGSYYSPTNFYANSVNIWANVVPSANLLAVPKESKRDLTGAREYLGGKDNWRAAVNRKS